MAPRALRKHRTQAKQSIDSITCFNCGSGGSEEELLLCDSCDSGCHTFCLRPILPCVPLGSWSCPSCSSASSSSENKPPKKFPLIQTKIVNFFKIKRASNFDKIDINKKRKRKSVLTTKRKKKLLPFNPCEDPKRRLEQMASLATALTSTGTIFSNELTYFKAPKSANCAALEKGGMQVLPKEDKETLIQCKNMMQMGEWPPLLVVFDPVEGFTVEADRPIKDLTIITEYVGDVDYLKNRENDYEGDSMMTLLSANDKSKSLVICPDKRSNIARFINGINNHTADGRKKQNLKCVRFDVDGECRVLLVAIRDIRKGERLYYDYNGDENEYPTHHFI